MPPFYDGLIREFCAARLSPLGGGIILTCNIFVTEEEEEVAAEERERGREGRIIS